MKMMTDEGIKVLDGSAYERDGVGFAGIKGFVGGFAACGKTLVLGGRSAFSVCVRTQFRASKWNAALPNQLRRSGM